MAARNEAELKLFKAQSSAHTSAHDAALAGLSMEYSEAPVAYKPIQGDGKAHCCAPLAV